MDDRVLRPDEVVGFGAKQDDAPRLLLNEEQLEEQLVDDLYGRSSAHHFLKRVLDLTVACLLILLFLPLIPIIVAAIWFDSGRPIIYTQERVRSRRVRIGDRWVWRLEPFTFYKFRTMYDGVTAATHEEYMAAYIAGDEEKLSELRPGHKEGPTYKLSEDSRVTPVGRILRSFSLDELPQLWNVILGHMSLVGPRPPIPYEVAMYRSEDMARFACRPGITGMWQVSGRSELSFDMMVALDVDYIRRQSLGLDLLILVRTIPAVFSRKGAG